MKKIDLKGSSKFALVDDDKYRELALLDWDPIESEGSETGYAGCTFDSPGGGKTIILMHRMILGLGPDDDRVVEHLDGNDLNNQKSNLRIVTRSQNQAGKRLSQNSQSGYKGVSPHNVSGTWQANICRDGKQVALGFFVNKEEAALAYSLASKLLHGKFGRSNVIPEDKYPSPERSEAIRKQVIKKILKTFPGDSGLVA